MKVVVAFLFCILFCIFLPVGSWAQNPFLTPPAHDRKPDLQGDGGVSPAPRPGRSQRQASAPTKVTHPLTAAIASVQRELRQKMTGYARQIQEVPFGLATWQLMALSLIYGVVHAIGPGHGKSIVCSYFISRRGTIKQAFLFGNMITAMHIFSAVVIVLGLSWVVGSANIMAFHSVEGRLEKISYAMIMLIGTFLLVRTIHEWLTGGHEESHECAPATTRSMLSLALATGLMPCPGAALILLFTLSLNIFWAGLLAMIPLALGMGLTASALGMITVSSTGFALKLTGRSRRTFILAHRTMACLGALIIIVLGAALYMDTLSP